MVIFHIWAAVFLYQVQFPSYLQRQPQSVYVMVVELGCDQGMGNHSKVLLV